jgi:hypothetical protein
MSKFQLSLVEDRSLPCGRRELRGIRRGGLQARVSEFSLSVSNGGICSLNTFIPLRLT